MVIRIRPAAGKQGRRRRLIHECSKNGVSVMVRILRPAAQADPGGANVPIRAAIGVNGAPPLLGRRKPVLRIVEKRVLCFYGLVFLCVSDRQEDRFLVFSCRSFILLDKLSLWKPPHLISVAVPS